MRLTLNTKKSLEKNAETYFERAKKARQKMQGVREALERFRREKTAQEKKQQAEEKQKSALPAPRKKRWYEKFRWFISSEGFLCIGGRDATTNEIIIKKHALPGDVVFHTEAPGSPFFVVKAEGRTPGTQTLQEAAQATAAFSRAWKAGVSSAEVFSVSPEQVTKQAKSGEYLAKGAFMIYGKRTNYATELALAIGVLPDGRIMGGPPAAVQKNCTAFLLLRQGDLRASEAAKRIIHKLNAGTPDEVIAALPAGGVRIVQ